MEGYINEEQPSGVLVSMAKQETKLSALSDMAKVEAKQVERTANTVLEKKIEPVMDDDVDNEGGQLKQKNGQKYVVNHRTSGFYVSKPCTILLVLLTLAAMLAVFLLTYFFLIPSCHSNNGYESNETLHAAGIHSSMNGHTNGHRYDEMKTTEPEEDVTTVRITTTTPTPTTTITAPQTRWSVTTKKPTTTDDYDDNSSLPNESEADDKEAELVFYEGWNPIKYRLIIEPNFETSKNNGTVAVDIARDPQYRGIKPISFDVTDMKITSVDVENAEGSRAKISYDSYYGNDNTSFHVLLTDTVGHINNFTVYLGFVSQLTDTLQGFYRGSYEEEQGGKSVFASTQFSPIDARRAFPCFDRPDKKANFEISLVHKHDQQTFLSNMPHSFSSIHRPGYVQEDFEPTPKMSTYLAAFHLSNLKRADHESDEEIDVDQPSINIYSRPEALDMTNYAYKLTKRLLPYLESYFNLKYKLPKLDLVAVPDFGFSGMENWGMITFRESALLVPENDRKSSSPEHLEIVTSVLAHELSHQWFGNLVTPKWWNDLWLKEGFAVFMSYECMNHVEPSWNMWDMFPLNELQKAMDKDSDRSSHPITFAVVKNSDIRRIFDPISYSKGATIIRMMNSFLGRDAFKAGISKYLKTYSFSNADSNDLWSVMTEAGHNHKTLPNEVDLKRVMDTWTLQAGYPVITVKRHETDLTISQQRYLLPHKDEKDDQKWYVPITVANKHDREGREQPLYWMTNRMDEMEIRNAVNTSDWVYLNVNRTGYYRVNYDYDSWKRLIRNFTELPAVIRAQLIDDAFALARAEFIDYDIPLTFLIVLAPHSLDIPSWAAAEKALQYLTDMVIREPAYESYRGVMRQVMKGPFEAVGFDELNNEDHQKSLHRARVAKLACEFGNDRCTNRAQFLFRDWMRIPSENKVPPSLKSVAYCTSLREGGVAEWQFAYKQYKETNHASEKEILLSALGCTTKPWLLSKYLNLTLASDSPIRKQDGARVFSSVAKNFAGYELAYEFLYTNIADIAKHYGNGFSTIAKMIDAVTTHMNSPYHKEQFIKFTRKVRKLGLTSIEKSIKLAEEQINNNIYWRSRSYNKLEDYLKIFIRDMHINVS